MHRTRIRTLSLGRELFSRREFVDLATIGNWLTNKKNNINKAITIKNNATIKSLRVELARIGCCIIVVKGEAIV